MNAKFIIALFLMIPIVSSSSIGIFPVNESVTIQPFKTFKTNIYVFNPSEKDVNVDINVSCKMGDKYYENVYVHPKRMTVEKNTNVTDAKPILLTVKNPVFFENKGVTKYSVTTGENYMKCKVYVKTDEPTSIIVTSNINVKLVGLNFSKLFFVLVFLIAFYFGIRKIDKKNKKNKKKDKA
ncbi:MAG: hypothetical protein N3D75_04335 [Candidatus Aenigmarchaeota archaeon]|nr:hypothetical protein [Candidatus Aenigmarchaeota archaeon]